MTVFVCPILFAMPCCAQITFAAAVRLAVENSPRVKAAQNDMKKAEAGVAITKDIYIPSVVVGGGVGDAYGITLTVPTIFTVSAQSLVFSWQQQSYIHAANADLKAARLVFEEVRQQVEEDAAVTYLGLEAAQSTASALKDQYGFAMKLAAIMQDRLNAHLESELEVLKYRRGAIQIKLARMQAEDSAEDLRGHLSELTGISVDQLQIMPETIPSISSDALLQDATRQTYPDTPGVLAAEASLKAKEFRAHGDAQYTWKPQVGFGATYGRVSPIENVSQFYNINGNYNTASFGFSVQFPILDRVRKAAAVQTRLDAERSKMDLVSIRSDETAGRHKMLRSIPELNAKAELADVNYDIAQNELTSTEIQSQHNTGGPILTPKDVMNAHIEERQKYVEMLDAKLQAKKAQITALRVTGQLDNWLHSALNRTHVEPGDGTMNR